MPEVFNLENQMNIVSNILRKRRDLINNDPSAERKDLTENSNYSLVALTEVTFKVLPIFEENKTLIIHNHKIEAALDAQILLVNSGQNFSNFFLSS